MVRWGIAGCGWVAHDFAAAAILQSVNGTLAAVHDRDPAAMARFDAPAFADLGALLAGVDALYVATPNHAHRGIVEAAARAGVPVLCEKPMATTMADAQAIVAACEDAGVLYATAFDQRFHAAHRRISALVAEGALGTVTAVRIVYACWVGPAFNAALGRDNWRVDPARAGGGALIDLAPHGLDLARMILGSQFVEIAAMGQTQVHAYPVEDGAVLMARAASGALVQMHVAYNCPETLPRRRLEVVGTGGQIVATDTMGQTPGGTLAFIDAATGVAHTLDVPGVERSPFLNQVEAFARAVEGEPFGFTPQDDLAIMALVLQAQAQARPELHRAA